MSDFKVQGTLVPSLHLDFHGLVLKDLFTHQTLTPPPSIDLTLFTSIIVKAILKKPFCAFVFLSHKNYSYYFTICPLDCDRSHVQVTSSLTHADSSDEINEIGDN